MRTLRLAPLLACLAAGCATAEPVIRLEAASPMRWQQGRAVQQVEQDGVTVALAYDRNLFGRVAFRLEIANRSGSPVLFDPAAAWSNYCVPMRKGPEVDCTHKRWLADPEAVSLHLEKQQSIARADATNNERFMTGLLILSVATDVASAGSGGPVDPTPTLLTASHLQGAPARRQTQELRFESALDFWQVATFRRTTLEPGEAASGLVLADSIPSALSVTVNVQVGKTTVPFVFRQHAFDARPTYRRPR